MAQSGYSYQYGNMSGGNVAPPAGSAMPSAPPMGSAAHMDEAPPTYEEAIRGGDPPGTPRRGSWRTGDVEAGFSSVPAPPAASGSSQAQTAAGDGGGGSDAPPSYNSLFGQIREAKESSSSFCDFLAMLFLMPLGCLTAAVIFVGIAVLVFGVPVALLAVGSYYMNDCPLEPGIPIWMVVGGLSMLLHILVFSRKKDDSDEESGGGCRAMLIFLCYLAWYIAGAAIIYPLWPPHYVPQSEWDMEYCTYPVYMAAFVVINILSGLGALLCCISSC